MELFLARHGQTNWNVGDRYQGTYDEPLNERGHQQAAELAAAVPRRIQQIVVSPLLRAQQTAAPIIEALGVPALTHAAFRERGFGRWEGLTYAEARALDPELFDRGGIFSFDEQPPGAEPLHELVARTGAGLRDVAGRFPEQSVLLIVHGFVIRALRLQLEHLAPGDLRHLPRPMNGELFHYSAERIERWIGSEAAS
ncbi:MAG: Phosphoglycerate mutase [Hydrocarboniphaga sp.]|uniref:histidine phosphatase family protein n=1 Tax=Hydrocarboniphaga sp. TaxID=2033016 RepID=UPI00262ACD24|nr:histidine phosphatase family protein [Hydrocarboniphaga sp.]MDB5973172.1 Phosphoglycerate mutase [Hydrocarboniphaga sp.]